MIWAICICQHAETNAERIKSDTYTKNTSQGDTTLLFKH